MQLTDQALAAVHAARRLAAAAEREANVGDLLAGLALCSDGAASRRLGGPDHRGLPRLAEHPRLERGDLPPLAAVFVAVPVMERPAWTTDLLFAATRVGGRAVAELAEVVGLDLPSTHAVAPPLPAPANDGEGDAELAAVVHETYGRHGLIARGLTDEADRVVGLARARGGSSTHLLGFLPVDAAVRQAAARAAPAVPITDVVELALQRGTPVGTGQLLDCVLLAAALRHLAPP